MAIGKLLAACTIPVAAGVAGTYLLVSSPASPATSGSWIDAPMSGITLDAGEVTVQAHAAGEAVPAIELEVDGKAAGSTSSLQAVDGLYYGTVAWSAQPGEHTIVTIANGVRSDPAQIMIVTPSTPPASPAPSPKPERPKPTSTPTPTPSPTPTDTPSPTPTPAPTESPQPPPKPKPTKPPAVPTGPVIASAGLSPRTVDHSDCGDYTPLSPAATISATITGATPATVRATVKRGVGGPITIALTQSGSVWSGTVTATQLDPFGTTESTRNVTWSVTVTATGAGRSVTRGAGGITLHHEECKP